MSNRPIINFDDHFAAFTSQWMEEHKGEYRNFDEMEADVPRIYLSFLNTRASWLDGLTPGSYFTQFEDPKDLVDWMTEYCKAGTPVPEGLMEQITFVGKGCEKRLMALLKDEDSPEEARMTAIGLLREMGSEMPKSLYISWQMNRAEKDDLKDNALESLSEMGKSVVQPILQNIQAANDAGQEALLEVLSRFPGDERIGKIALRLFKEKKGKRALMAGYLAKIGDESALPALLEAAADPEIHYLTYIEIRNAIEELGGECPEREFDEDPEYEAMRQLDG